jgi:hypothetical protein
MQHGRLASSLVALILASAAPAWAQSPLPPAGNPGGQCPVPPSAGAEDSSRPTTVVGDGTPESCTGEALVAAVAHGGVITFACGTADRTIVLERTAKVFNDAADAVVIDGGGKVTLSGGGRTRILYQDTCDPAQHWTSAHCDDQETPRLTVQNITFVDGNSGGADLDGGGGGAIFARGGHLKVVNSRFFHNVCEAAGPDVGGAAVRALDQGGGAPVYVVNSTFGGAPGLGNVCSNGGGLSAIGVSYTVLNSDLSFNQAVGSGANPARQGTPGGGSGGAIYNDGNTYGLTICGTRIHDNAANEGGGAIFFVSNDLTGSVTIQSSQIGANPNLGFESEGLPGMFILAGGRVLLSESTVR